MSKIQVFKVVFWSHIAGFAAMLFSALCLNHSDFQDLGCFAVVYFVTLLFYGTWMELNNQKKRGRVNGN